MKSVTKIIICMLLSVTVGIVATTPLLVSELDIQPWVTRVQGPKAPFNMDFVYANFTVINQNTPITENSGPTISYYAIINVTNPTGYTALLTSTQLWAAQNIQNTTNQGPLDGGDWSMGNGGLAEGAWVDGVLYDVTWFSPWPSFDANGTLTQSSWDHLYQDGYWMEGVQFYTRTVHNDTCANSYIYLNMNGTWVDVTGRITVDIPESGPTYGAFGMIVDHQIYYQNFDTGGGNFGYVTQKVINIGDDAFDNHFAPGESRLLFLSGSWDVRTDCVTLTETGYINPVDVIKSGIIQTMTKVFSDVDVNRDVGNNAFLDTYTYTETIQQIFLTPVGNSYIYNAVLSDNQMFQLDQYGAEVFIVSGS